MRWIVLTVMSLAMTSTVTAESPSKAPIEREIEKLVSLFSDGYAVSYPQYWHIEFGKIFEGSGHTDAVAVFSLEGFNGGNDDHQYLAFFKSVAIDPEMMDKSHPYQLVAVTQIGGRGWREFDHQKIKMIGTNFVTLSGKLYGPNDAMCCPSIPINMTFCVKDGAISESK